MNIFVENKLSGLIPLYPSDLEEKKKLKLNKEYKAVITNPRNIEFHKKYFALLNLGYQNSQLDVSFEFYRAYVIMKAGYAKTAITPNGTIFLPESISFASMEQQVFEELYSRSVNVIIKDIGATSEDIEKELRNFF